ncbi:MAG TPA: hypothetical protein PLV27_07320 [Anaerolineaceae bacterium]|nr:hypothetical protein [Anaerolineaceae bacterium]HOV07051.1 hypothetical protein [Anaerolineaceae bacterium]
MKESYHEGSDKGKSTYTGKNGEVLGFDLDEAEGIKPATGAEAFATLSNTEQLRILGPAKYAAWKEGKFRLGDLIGRKYDVQWGWTRYEKSMLEMGLNSHEWLAKYRANPAKDLISIGDAADQILEIHEQTNGATFSLFHGNMVGKPYKSVSVFPDLGQKFAGKKITKDQLVEFMSNHEELLRNEKVVVGTWFNPDDNRTYLDFSVIIQDRELAISLGKKYNQIGIFDLENMEYIEVGGTGEDIPDLPALQDRLRDLL